LISQALSKNSPLPLGRNGTSSPIRILVVEDTDADATRVQDALLRVGVKLLLDQPLDIKTVTDVEGVMPYLDQDSIDIYFVDLKIRGNLPTIGDKLLGEYLIEKISESSNAGIIVYSSESVETHEARSLLAGADSYIGKTTAADTPDIILSTAMALWRRIRPIRVISSKSRAHARRRFLLGSWLFNPESRELQDNGSGRSIRLSQLEQVLLRHLVLVEGHEIDRETFAAYVLGRTTDNRDRRLDSIVTRLRAKLGGSVQIVSREGGYKLIDVDEIEQI
jgi:DNA-binding response OmpR family regulator